jgi:hypothetical protein
VGAADSGMIVEGTAGYVGESGPRPKETPVSKRAGCSAQSGAKKDGRKTVRVI